MHPTLAGVVCGNVASTCLSALSGVSLADCTPGKLIETGGMRGFLGSAPAFSGSIKERPGDFRVNEVSLMGELVTVSDADVEDTNVEFYVPEPSVAPALPASEGEPPPKMHRGGSSDNSTKTDSGAGGAIAVQGYHCSTGVPTAPPAGVAGGAVGQGGADGEVAGSVSGSKSMSLKCEAGGTEHRPAARDPELERLIRNAARGAPPGTGGGFAWSFRNPQPLNPKP